MLTIVNPILKNPSISIRKSWAELLIFATIMGSRLIHISTDFVFDGVKGNYSELDNPNPLSVYAKSKLEGEVEARRCGSYSILRPSVVYGWTPLETQASTSSSGKPMNFALWAISKMNKGEDLKVVNDQFTSPTLADILAAVAIRAALADRNDLYHVSGESCLSRYEFTRKIGIAMGYSTDTIKAVSSDSFVQAAPRPINSCLNCEKIQKELTMNCRHWSVACYNALSNRKEAPQLLGN